MRKLASDGSMVEVREGEDSGVDWQRLMRFAEIAAAQFMLPVLETRYNFRQHDRRAKRRKRR